MKYRPGLHRGVDRGSAEACRKCWSAPARECLGPGSGRGQTRCLGAAAAPYPGSAGSASDWTGRPASPVPTRGGTLRLQTEVRSEATDGLGVLHQMNLLKWTLQMLKVQCHISTRGGGQQPMLDCLSELHWVHFRFKSKSTALIKTKYPLTSIRVEISWR